MADWSDEIYKYVVGCGLGFNTRTNQYKVIRVFDQYILNPITRKEEYDSTKAEIHTLGSGSWESMGDLISFNLDDDEQFQSVPFPSHENDDTVGLSTVDNMSMGVLQGCLCICDASDGDSIHVWFMKKHGVQQSWTKMFSIDTLHDERLSNCLYLPMNCLKDGAVLMFNYSESALVCFDPKGSKFKYLGVRGVKSEFDAIAYSPSFIPLKDDVVGDNVVVLNISSR
ncbi:F-box protein At3g07870-like [Cornus florida]|uniref:F-box protein At3g07870-like n=1 Tax=Cornus florida TaxID=4283 RepID=UPI00289A45B0|nr:F-box protein At3g07870-like [Cornus florida]